MLRNKKGMIWIIVVGIMITLVINSKTKGFDKAIETIKKDEYNGTVTDKFNDRVKYNGPVVILSNGRIVRLYSYEYDKISINDSLSKKTDSTILQIFKKDTVITIDESIYINYLKNKNK